MQMTTHTVASNLSTEQFMRRERRRLKAKHIWIVANLGWGVLHERLFLNKYGSKQGFYENE